MTPLERLLTKFTNQCTETQTYPFERDLVTITIDWKGITQKVQQFSGRKHNVIGGLYPKRWFGYFLPSFAYAGENASYICLYPGNWRRKLYYAAGLQSTEPLDPKQIMTFLIAHEARHIQQGVRGYGGLKNVLLFPGIFLALPAALVTAIATLAGTLSFWWPLGLFVYYRLARSSYFYDPREVDARHYAQKHVHEWEDFVTIVRTTHRKQKW